MYHERIDVESKRISLELKGAFAGLAAASAVVGAAFGLAAFMRSGTPAVALAPAPATDPASSYSGIGTAQVVEGHAFYTESCVVCHGVGGRGGDGPRLIGLSLSDEQIAETIRSGIKGEMPAFGQKFQQTQAIIVYLRSLKK